MRVHVRGSTTAVTAYRAKLEGRVLEFVQWLKADRVNTVTRVWCVGVWVCGYVGMWVCECGCVRLCVCACACARVRGCGWVLVLVWMKRGSVSKYE